MSDPGTNPCSTLIDQHITANRGERSALKYGESRYSFNDLAALTNRAGNVLRDLGVGVDDNVLVLVRPSPAYFAAVFSAMTIGAVPVIEGEGRATTDAAGKFSEVKAIVVDQSRVGEIDSDTTATVLVVGEEAGVHQSFVALLRAGASSLTAVPRDQNATALAILGQHGAKSVSGAELLIPGVFSGHAFADSLEALAAGDTIDINRKN